MTNPDMRTFVYDGPVCSFGKVVKTKWHAETSAVSPAKALNNLRYRYNAEHNRTPNTKVELDYKYLKG